jgi:protein-S-isoprenylcysteine O-methyltransferase Ste14
MKLKGMGKLHEKLPAYPGKKLAILPIKGIVVTIIAYVLLICLDILPRLFGLIDALVMLEPFLPLLGSLLVLIIAYSVIGQLWSARDRMKTKYGNLAYQKMIQRGMLGVFLVPPLVFHQLTSIRSLPPVPPVNDITVQWSQSLLPLIGITLEWDLLLRIVVSAILFILGLLTVRSALLTFGIDYMGVVYLYFPEESKIQDHEIYSVIRHPTYFGGVLLGLAGLVFRFSVYSFLMFFTVYGIFWLQARREERELVKRFGESYKDYIKKVPRLHISFKNMPTYFRFLRQHS